MIDRVAIAVTTWVLRGVASLVGRPHREWLDALLAELDTLPRGARRRAWALGGLRLAALLAVRSGTRFAWWRHPARSAALALGAPPQALGARRPGAAGTRQYLTALACACAAGLSVLVLRGLLEDSPYAFNAGQGAPAGVHPDWANPMSLAFDLVVFASAAELLGMLALTVCLLRFASAGRVRIARPVRAALIASAVPLWVLVGATLLFGWAAHQSAPTIFDQGRAGGLYLTWVSWVGLATVLATAAAVMTIAGVGRGRRPETESAPTG